MSSEQKETAPRDENRTGYLAVCGISHRTATLSEREPFHVGRADLVAAVKLYKTLPGVREVVLVATCNRFEAYSFLDDGTDAFGVTCEFFRRLRGVEAAERRNLFYVRSGSTVARHLFRVIAGIDSLVLGEYQIQSQVKEAYSAACSTKGAGKALHRLFHAAFRTGKAVRSRTSLGAGQYSVAGVAVGILKESLDREDAVLLVGVNESVRIVAEGLKAAGFGNLLFANRTAYKAEKMAARFDGEWSGLDDLPDLLARCQGLVSCTGAPGTVINASTLEASAQRSGSCPVLIVDMAVPRDVETPRGLPDGTRIVNLEDLKAHLEMQTDGRRADLPAAESLIEDMVATFQVWMESAFDPGVANLAKEYDRIRKRCLDDAKGLFRPEDHAELERVSRRLMQQFLRVPASSFLETPDPSLEEGLCRHRKARESGAPAPQRAREGRQPPVCERRRHAACEGRSHVREGYDA